MLLPTQANDLGSSREPSGARIEGGAHRTWVRIGGVSNRRSLVLAIFIYVTLDLSHPGMPGAFVFEPTNSAESTQVRARAAVETVSTPAMAADPRFALSRPPGQERPTSSFTAAIRPVRRAVSWQSRLQYDSAPPLSEDPH